MSVMQETAGIDIRTRRLLTVVQELSAARTDQAVREITRHAARQLLDADGATFVLRDEDVAAGDDAGVAAEQARCAAERIAADARESALRVRERERENDQREQGLDDRDAAITDRESLQEQRDILCDERAALLHDARQWQQAREQLVDQREAEWDQAHGLPRPTQRGGEASPPVGARHRPDSGE